MDITFTFTFTNAAKITRIKICKHCENVMTVLLFFWFLFLSMEQVDKPTSSAAYWYSYTLVEEVNIVEML